jgi:hypothetical protein
MTKNLLFSGRLMAAFALVALPVGAIAAATATGQAGSSAQTCEISSTPKAGLTKLDALVHATKSAAGTYTFRVQKTGGGGSSTINQSGDFDAAAGQTATLSSVSIGSAGAAYKATLDVKMGGDSFSCTKQIGGS